MIILAYINLSMSPNKPAVSIATETTTVTAIISTNKTNTYRIVTQAVKREDVENGIRLIPIIFYTSHVDEITRVRILVWRLRNESGEFVINLDEFYKEPSIVITLNKNGLDLLKDGILLSRDRSVFLEIVFEIYYSNGCVEEVRARGFGGLDIASL